MSDYWDELSAELRERAEQDLGTVIAVLDGRGPFDDASVLETCQLRYEIAEAAQRAGVDPATVVKLRTVAKQGVLERKGQYSWVILCHGQIRPLRTASLLNFDWSCVYVAAHCRHILVAKDDHSRTARVETNIRHIVVNRGRLTCSTRGSRHASRTIGPLMSK